MRHEPNQDMVTQWKKAAADYPAEFALAKKAGLMISVQALRKPLPLAGDNAALLYRQLAEMPRSHGSEKALNEFLALNAPTSAQLDHARQVLASSSPLLRLVHQAATRPKCVFDRPWDGPNAASMPMPELAIMRSATRLLLAEALLLAHQGKGKGPEAIRTVSLGRRIAEQAVSDGTLIAWLVGVAIDNIVLAGMERILLVRKGEATVAHAIGEQLDKQWKPLPLAPVIAVETALQQMEIDEVRRSGFFAYQMKQIDEMFSGFAGISKAEVDRGRQEARAEQEKILRPETRALVQANEKTVIDASAAFMLRWMRKLKTAADLPYPQAKSVFAAFQRDLDMPPSLPDSQKALRVLPATVMVALGHSIVLKASSRARATTLYGGARLLEQQALHGFELPETLGGMPKDPFDGQPLRYRKEGVGKSAGFVFYSVGPDGTFDGGKRGIAVSNPNRNLLFRYTPADS